MITEAIDRVLELAEDKVVEVRGEYYSRDNLKRIATHINKPSSVVHVKSLDTICDLLEAEAENFDGPIFVHVSDYDCVQVFTSYNGDFSRNELYEASPDVPGFKEGWRNHDQAIIEVRSLLKPTEDTKYLLEVLGSISAEKKVTSKDNGVTQTIEATQGIALTKKVELKPIVSITPFRTFLEVEQPESEYLLRMDENRGVGFFEADGGVWKLEARRVIAEYLKEQLNKKEIGAPVVVTR